MNWISEHILNYIGKVVEFYQDKTNILAGTTIGSTIAGTTTEVIRESGDTFDGILIFNRIPVYVDLLSLFQYTAYTISIIVGILTIISWFRKNRKRKE